MADLFAQFGIAPPTAAPGLGLAASDLFARFNIGDDTALRRNVGNELAIEADQLELAANQLESALSAEPEQAALQRQVIDLTRQQVELSRAGVPTDPAQLAQAQQRSQQLLNLSLQQADQAVAFEPVQNELLQTQLNQIRRSGEASPRETELIRQAVQASLLAGESDIDRQAGRSLEQLREELAPSLGLRSTDTPILDRGARVSEEAIRLKGQLAQQAAAAQAQALLNFPLQRGAVIGDQVTRQQAFAKSVQDFQQQLEQQSVANRLGLAGVQSAPTPNFTGLSSNTQGQVQQGIQSGLGLAQGTTVSGPTSGGVSETSGASQLPALIGGAGGLLEGLGAISKAGGFASIFGSARDLKHDNTPIDEDAVLARVVDLPVERWRYKEGLGLATEPHIGTYAEDFRDSLGLGDGRTLDLIDTTGVLMASVKSLGKKVERLESGLGLADENPRDVPEAGLGLARSRPPPAGGLGLAEAA